MAGAMVGGAFLSAALQVLFDRLATREVMNLFTKRTSHVLELFEKLSWELQLLNGVLDDADVKQFTDKTVKAWSDKARDVVYQADDLVEEIAYEALRCKVEADHDNHQSSTSQVKDMTSSSSVSFDEVIEPKLEKIIQLLEDLFKRAQLLGLKERVQRVTMSTTRSPSESSSSLVVESDVYGRDSEKEVLMGHLLSDETAGNEVGVIPVVGMGGLGKTTLVRLAYNDDRVDHHFEMKAWVCVSQEFDVLRVTKTILESITKCTCNSTNLNQVQESLREELRGREFIVVLDDVWNENYGLWDSFRTPFRTGAPGSKIIVTTRIQHVAAIMNTGGVVVNLQILPDGDCWSMFAKIAFNKRDPSGDPLLEDIGRKIVKRCKGLPLAVKSIAGLLRSKFDVEEWDDILKSEFWDLPESHNDILPALMLSYHYLRSQLKLCFAFCSLFPKNYKFKEEQIVSLWIAERFVQVKGGKSYEMEGKKCFRELLSMSFFQPYKDNESSFVMHDLIHDLAQVVAGEFSFRLGYEKPHEIPIKVRHLSFSTDWENCFQQLLDAQKVNGLRTFLPIYGLFTFEFKNGWHDVLSRQKHMRVLSLPLYQRGINELPGLIGSLIHLHYLNLSYTSIRQLPESICRLYNLETLLLVHCEFLTTLPIEIGKLLSLRRMDVTGRMLREMPMQTSCLKGLEYLTEFVVGKCSGLGIEGLKGLSSLRGLQIGGLENVIDSKGALEAKLKEKEHLATLHLKWGLCVVTDDSQFEREVLENLQPHTNLKELTITRYRGTRFPDWLGDDFFTKMVTLRLEECNNCVSLPPLGQLPFLRELTFIRMGSVERVGHEFYGSCAGTYPPFPSLERLCFEGMSEWVEWQLPGIGEFPKIQELEMFDSTSGFVEGVPGNSCSIKIKRGFTDNSPLVLIGSKAVDFIWHGLTNLTCLRISHLLSLRVFPSKLHTLSRLKELDIRECPDLLSLFHSGFPPNLERLDISQCELLQSVIDGMISHQTCKLRKLSIYSCQSLVSFAADGLPSTLLSITFHKCPKLEFPNTESYPSVEKLRFSGCLALTPLGLVKSFPNLRNLDIKSDDNLSNLDARGCAYVPCILQQGGLAKLTHITMRNCKSLKSLPDGLGDLLPLIESMTLEDCPEMESFGEVGLVSSLSCLFITQCEKLVSFRSEWGLHRLPSLQRLLIMDADESVESFPDEGLLPSSLTSLWIGGFPNLKMLNWRGFQHLTSLQDLGISRCPQLQSLPEEGLPPSICNLEIYGCPLLRARCQKDTGDDWGKIAHIPYIELECKVISSSQPSPSSGLP